MAVPDRYFSECLIDGATVLLSGPEAHHLIHVMRARIGTRVVLFDGSGQEFLVEVQQVGRSEARLCIVSAEEVNRELPFELTLAVALPKGDRQKWLVEKAVELGVTRLMPLRTDRSVSQAGEEARTRLRRTVIEASKQCGRNRLMEIGNLVGWSDFVARCRDMPSRLLAHPASGNECAVSACFLPTKAITTPVCMAIGPEGGFTDEEVGLAVATGWQIVDLGTRILRIETAAVFLASAIISGAFSK